MEKNEHVIFLDIPSGRKCGKFHSAVLTTYAIDLIHFDCQVLNMLHRKEICSINIFADNNQIEKSMEYVNPIFMKNIGKEYSVTSIYSKGAFHPKINFFVGDKSILVLFGTGNLTVAGHGKNHEAFTGFMIDETNETHQPLIEECWQYITQFTNQCNAFERNRILKEVSENCTYLNHSFKDEPHRMKKVQADLDAALLYNEPNSGILQQIVNLVPLIDVQKVTVVSPYFDEHGESLITISKLCPNAKIDILIHEKCSLPPCMMPSKKRVTFYDFCETKRGKLTFKTYDRQLHAKILHFKTATSEYCVIGSANATKAGLGTVTHRGINEEFCVLYYSKDKDFLSILGLKTKKKLKCEVSSMKRYENNVKSNTQSKYKILSAQYENGKITVKCNELIPSGILLAIDNGIDVIPFKQSICNKEGKFVIDTKLKKTQYTCLLINKKNECISNRVFINWIELLETTNPSKTSRNLNRFISHIENEGYEGIEIADMLSDIMWNLVNEQDRGKVLYFKTSSKDENNKNNTLPEIKYKIEYDNDNEKNRNPLLLDRTSRLIECIEDSINSKIRLIDNAIIDEEETGSADISYERDVDEQVGIVIDKKHIKDYGDLSTSILKKYQKLVDKRIEQIRVSRECVITKDDLNYFSLSFFAAMEICYLNRFRYQFDGIDTMSRSYYQKKLYDSLDLSITYIGIDAIEKFVKFCKIAKGFIPQDENYRKIAYRTMKYVILYGTLFFKFASRDDKLAYKKRIIQTIKYIESILGMPPVDYLSIGLTPLSEKYDYVFRMMHVDKFLLLLHDSS